MKNTKYILLVNSILGILKSIYGYFELNNPNKGNNSNSQFSYN